MSDRRSITLLNGTGDVTISWTKDKDANMIKWIESKMKEGYTFFTLPDSFIERLATLYKKQPITSVLEVGRSRTIYLDDEAAEKLAGDGVVQVSKTPQVSETTGYARTAGEVIQHKSTAALRPIRGG